MKNWFKKLITSALVLTASVGLTGCFGNKNDDDKKETYTFVNYDDSYYVNEEFSIVGTKLKITDKNGKEKVITVTNSMIKTMPNMSTAGEKKITIVYNGNEYVFTITVHVRPESPTETMLEKLENFLKDYDSTKNSLAVGDVTTDITARYFNKSVKLEDYQSLVLLSQMFDDDKLANTAYDGILDAIVKGSFNINENNIINARELKAKLEYVKTLDSLKETVSDFDYYSYILSLILPESDDYYISKATDYICDSMYVTSKVGKAEIKTIVSGYYNKIKSLESFKPEDVFIEILDSVNKYTADVIIKEATANVVSKSLDEISHIISDCLYTYFIEFNVMNLENVEDYLTNDVEITYETSTMARSLISKQANAYKNVALTIENTIIDLAKPDKNLDYKQTILDTLQAGIDFTTEIIEVNNILKTNEYVFVTNFDNDFEIATEGLYRHYVGPRPDYEVRRWFEPYYDSTLDSFNTAKDYLVEIYDAIDTRGVFGTIRYYELVEKAVDYYGINDTYRDNLITAAYKIIDNENLDGQFVYETLVDNLLLEEDSVYIDLAVDYISEYTYIESNAGRIALEEIITTYFNKIKNVETFSTYNMFMQIADIINEHTTDDYVRNITDNLLTEDVDEVAHILSELVYISNINNNEIVLEENLKNVTVGEELYITSTEATNLIERYARNQQSLIKNIEDFCLELHNIFESVDENKETNAQDLILTTVDNFTKICEEEIAILETCEQNQWVIWDTNAESSVDYEGDFDECNDYKEIFTAIYDVLDIAFNLKEDFEGTVNGLIERRKEEIVDYVMLAVDYIGGGLNEEDELYQEIETLLTDTIDDYIADTIDTEELTSEIDRIINEYGHEDFITLAKATHMLVMSQMYDEETDYNEMFKDLDLPYQIESVDYNVLMEKLFSTETYEIFKLSDVVVEYVTDEDGKVIGEVLTLDVDVNFDAMIASIKGDVRLTLTLDFQGIEIEE